MIAIQNTLVSDDILEKQFCCDIPNCKGVCCIEGDAGAPLEDSEIEALETHYPLFKKYMSPQGIDVIENGGEFFDLDGEGHLVTPLIENRNCAYLYTQEDGIAYCAIEKAFLRGEVPFRKPISCFLYPIRVAKLNGGYALNYHEWDLCACALKKGKNEKTAIFEFLKEPLILRFGKDWYDELLLFAKNKLNNNELQKN